MSVSTAQLDKFIRKHYTALKGVVSQKEFDRMSPKERRGYLPYKEAIKVRREAQLNFARRFEVIRTKQVEMQRVRKLKSGKEVAYTTKKTVRTYRDKFTGRFIDRKAASKMRRKIKKEFAIRAIAERKGITIKEAKEHFKKMEKTRGLKEIFRIYAPSPK